MLASCGVAIAADAIARKSKMVLKTGCIATKLRSGEDRRDVGMEAILKEANLRV